ncbi:MULTISPECIES: hypothetical protein [Bradyrhizobium]|uniref:hypothetical protein n=1 Tax=Bradyrhizobium TaxID=374 RepID=UPI001456D072|nr:MULTISPECIES: hypothetical protein [Bradyrhizobium]MCP1853323.1 hypothetical protein [Bradyrhizobium sp. USDA 4541]MCP1908047.1 hypothetical protein [Bradyrhizobium elkanii]NLS74938.1 hypothetical protein [Bradyrhizobium brasilense]
MKIFANPDAIRIVRLLITERSKVRGWPATQTTRSSLNKEAAVCAGAEKLAAMAIRWHRRSERLRAASILIS